MPKLSMLSGTISINDEVAFEKNGERYFTGNLTMSGGVVPFAISEYQALSFRNDTKCLLKGYVVTEHKDNHLYTYFLVRDISLYEEEEEENDIYVTGVVTHKKDFVVGSTPSRDHIVVVLYTMVDKKTSAVLHIYAHDKFARELNAVELKRKVNVRGYLTVKGSLSITAKELSIPSERRRKKHA